MTSIIYVEYNTVHSDHFIFQTNADQEYWLIILTHTPALFLIDGVMKEYPSNCVALFPPKTKILYRACADTYSDDWMRFLSTEPLAIEPDLVPMGIPFLVPDPKYFHNLFQLFAPENFFENDYKAITIDYLFRILFNKLLEASQHTNACPLYYHALLNLRKEIYNHPKQNWTISVMANHVKVSTNYIQKLYKDTFGVTCMNDVILSRINLAKEHLVHSPYSVIEIANLCGYNSMEHFYRQFKKITGFTPCAFRKSNARLTN